CRCPDRSDSAVLHTEAKSVALGVLVTRLMAPPVAPRPKSTDEGPKKTSTASTLKVSRVYQPLSRPPSRNMSFCAEKPRMRKESPWRPPSPALEIGRAHV